jgi:hypothetical protein
MEHPSTLGVIPWGLVCYSLFLSLSLYDMCYCSDESNLLVTQAKPESIIYGECLMHAFMRGKQAEFL